MESLATKLLNTDLAYKMKCKVQMEVTATVTITPPNMVSDNIFQLYFEGNIIPTEKLGIRNISDAVFKANLTTKH